MQIIKRDGTLQEYSNEKIKEAIRKAFTAQEKIISESALNDIVFSIENEIEYCLSENSSITVEWIQDHVEMELMRREYYKEVRSYILYREQHKKAREAINRIVELVKNKKLAIILKKIQKDFNEDIYDLSFLDTKLESLVDEDVSSKEALSSLIEATVQLISKEAPKYEFIAGRLKAFEINEEVDDYFYKHNILSFYEKIKYYKDNGFYGDYLLDNYSEDEIDELGSYIDYSKDDLLTYAGIELISEKYLIHIDERIIEKPQDMFMAIAMTLAMKEDNRITYAKEFYDVLSSLKVMISSSTLFNTRKPMYQLASCFVSVVPDDLQSIYKCLDNFAAVSKYGGGMGLYFGKVRAQGSEIKGINGNAAGVCKWVKLVNDTVFAVEQYGVRKSACTVYLDAWHKDLPEFLKLRTNKDDVKISTPDIHPAVCFPDLFWKMAKNNINGTWYLFCPNEIKEAKGYCLEDYYGNNFEDKYWDCIKDERISRVEVPIKEMLRLIFKSICETGTPYIFNRDEANRQNPNKHCGMIYCSSLYGEIAQNTKIVDNENIVVIEGKTISSNLASLNLGKIDVNNNEELKSTIDIAVRLLDNAIDLNNLPMDNVESDYRSIGLGVLGYHNCLANNGIEFDTNKHLEFMNRVFERINFFAINASCVLAKERGAYKYFYGSGWHTGEYFDKHNYNDSKWEKMKAKVLKYGLRNAYLLAVSPTTSTSIIAGTTAGIDPILNKLMIEEKNNVSIIKVAPDLNNKTFWLYKNANLIEQEWLIDACATRQKHIDQSQSLNLYISSDISYSRLLSLLLYAFNSGIKTIAWKLI